MLSELEAIAGHAGGRRQTSSVIGGMKAKKKVAVGRKGSSDSHFKTAFVRSSCLWLTMRPCHLWVESKASS